MRFKAASLLALTALVLGFAAATRPSWAQDGLSISGTVWHDENFDGVRQAEELGARFIEVILIGPAGEKTLQTDSQGRYSFEGLANGRYRVRLADAHHTSYLTYPVRSGRGPYEIAVTLGATSAELDFGLHSNLVIGDERLPEFHGLVFKDAEPVNHPRVAALIGGKDCTGPVAISPPGAAEPARYELSVASDDLIPGCGKPGDTIRFTINGQVANQTAEWRRFEPWTPGMPPPVAPPGDTPPVPAGLVHSERLDLTVGPAFAWWNVSLQPVDLVVQHAEDTFVDALIDGTLCARSRLSAFFFLTAMLVVPPRELRPGCGYEGATVTFAINGLPLPETAVWRAGASDSITLSLPAQALPESPIAGDGRITPPATGSGALR